MFSSFLYGNLNGSESCENNIICWPDYFSESRAIALVLLSSGAELCSGSLLMSTDQSFRPYFLTAFHCIDIAPADGILSAAEIANANNWMFKFQYKMTTCTGNTPTAGITYNGATLRASWSPSDFALTELLNSPVGNLNIAWLGWDRSGNTPSSGAGIHHPEGDVMKISFETNQFQTSSWGGTDNHWLLNFDDGVVEHGSSGSPILDQNKRVVGQLHGNQNYNSNLSHCAQPRAEYGRFNLSWNGGGTNTSRLSNWLDSCNIGSLTTNTMQTPYIYGYQLVCSSGTSYFVSTVPTGYTISWNASYNLTLPTNTHVNPIIATAYGNGPGWVQATLSSTCKTITLPHYAVWVGTPVLNVTGDATSGCTNTTHYFTASPTGPYANESNYTWSLVPLNGNYLSPYGYQNNSCAITFYNPYSASGYSVQARAQNSCGTGGYGSTSIYIHNCYYFSLSPNPASETVTVTKKASGTTDGIASAAISEDASTIYTIRIVDFYGKLYYSTTKSGESFTFPVSNLKDGQYIVQITDGKNPTNLTLIVKH
jgi:lysyl endopeptidase